MKKLIFVFSLSALFSATAHAEIAGWKDTPGISEQEAVQLTNQAIENFLSFSDDGESCGVGEVWNYEREKDLKPDRPERGEIFAITAYATGPDEGCAITRNFDCRVVFNKPPGASLWKTEYTDCEPTGAGSED